MPFILSGNVGSATAATGYDVANSARFNDGSSDYLDHTHNAVTSTRKQTFSVWVKRSHLTSYQYIISTKNGTNTDRDGIAFSASDQIDIRYGAGSSSPIRLTTNRLFRDPSAWYHIVVAVDTTQGTAGNRIKLYVNGVQETSFATSSYMDQNYDFALNAKTDQATGIGVDGRLNDAYFDGYFSEFVAIDNQQLAADQFGEFDDSGIWKPIDVSGITFGDAGFYMNFETAAELGTDVSGNSNTFAENNLTAVDQSTDTCTNNFCTINSLDNFYAAATLAEGNLKVTCNASNTSFITSTFGLTKGKWYWEAKLTTVGGEEAIGITDIVSTATDNYAGQTANSYSFKGNNGNIRNADENESYGSAYGTSVIGVYMDLDNNKLYFAINGTIQASGAGFDITAAASTTNGFYFPMVGDVDSDSPVWEVNFGNPVSALSSAVSDANGFGSFEYSPSDGGSASFDSAVKSFLAICTKNLAESG